MSELALLGGTPVLDGPPRPYRSIGPAEKAAVAAVLESGCLSGFYGSPGPEFLGGPKVREFEALWAQRYEVRHAVTVNSNTSGLVAAMGAVGVSPGDEVILPAWSMSATAMAPLVYGGIPVFADIEDDTFCIDLAAVEAAITARTRAILVVNLFGHPAALAALRKLADARGLYLVEDNAQAPLAFENGRAAGTVGHIGVFSLNYHKHIHTGEGGVCVTGDDELALRLQMIRNHAENLVETSGIDAPVNLVGFNFRMTEMSAAVGIEQLRRAEEHVRPREALAAALTSAVSGCTGLRPPRVRARCRHNYYVWMLRYDAAAVGISRDTFSKALAAEGFPHAVGYARPLYKLPLFQRRIAIGRGGWPFTLTDRTYADGLCPVTERLHRDEALLFEPCAYDADEAMTERLCAAIRKVYERRHDLVAYERRNER
ncbi:MAG TPA: DegT/DnrJ/EryC1/StrS family aminotransferase [Alphaproteobacteria bacterium]|jgi:dTDP-4-amino-4,6-dideoxygalactose transaminase